jgi:hypothetical protein
MLVLYTLQYSLLALVLTGLPLAACSLTKALYKHSNSKTSLQVGIDNTIESSLLAHLD